VKAGLTYRERQLLDHVTKGYTNQEIADRLGLTVAMIKVLSDTALQENARAQSIASSYRRLQSNTVKPRPVPCPLINLGTGWSCSPGKVTLPIPGTPSC
jgi:hypothetical protein